MLGTAARAGERTDFLVNDDGGLTAQNYPRIATAGDRGFVIVWVDRRYGHTDIFMQRFGADGYPIGDNVRVNDDGSDCYQSSPAVATDFFGAHAVVWRDYRNSVYPFQPDIYLQSYDTLFYPVGTNLNLTDGQPDSTKESPDLALARSNWGVAVWADYRNRDWDIYGQVIRPDGNLVGSNFRVNDDIGSNQQHAPRVTVSSLGWFVVSWYDNRLGNDDIFVQRFDSLGNRLGINIQCNTDVSGARQAFPDVTTDGVGNFTVVWVDWRNGTYPANPDIYSRKFDSLMTPLAQEIRVNTDATEKAQREPAIAADRMGNVAIVWSDSTITSWDVTGQMIDVDGVVREANFRANATAEKDQLTPDVALDGCLRYVTWADNRSGNWDIYAAIQMYNDLTLHLQPSALSFEVLAGRGAPTPQWLTVSHAGYNSIEFSVYSDTDWLSVTPAAGTTIDSVLVSVTADALAAGTYVASLVVASEVDGISPIRVTVVLDVVEYVGGTDDTLVVAAVSAGSGMSAQTSVLAEFANEVDYIALPLKFDVTAITVDSVRADPSLLSTVDFSGAVDNISGLVQMLWEKRDAATCFNPGGVCLGDIFFTAAGTTGTVLLEPLSEDTLAPLVRMGQIWGTPVTVAGEVSISPSTGMGGEFGASLPSGCQLYQNQPNPFNATTIINYELPTLSQVSLDIYNILGQPVKRLVSEIQPPGLYAVCWNGQLDTGAAAPTGIYFCRLRTKAVSVVRRLVLVR